MWLATKLDEQDRFKLLVIIPAYTIKYDSQWMRKGMLGYSSDSQTMSSVVWNRQWLKLWSGWKWTTPAIQGIARGGQKSFGFCVSCFCAHNRDDTDECFYTLSRNQASLFLINSMITNDWNEHHCDTASFLNVGLLSELQSDYPCRRRMTRNRMTR